MGLPTLATVSFLFCKNLVIEEFVLRLGGERPGTHVFQVSRRAGHISQEINRHWSMWKSPFILCIWRWQVVTCRWVLCRQIWLQ